MTVSNTPLDTLGMTEDQYREFLESLKQRADAGDVIARRRLVTEQMNAKFAMDAERASRANANGYVREKDGES